MKIVIIGADGFIGSEFFPCLVEAGAKVLLAGRNNVALSARFLGRPVCVFSNLDEAGKGHDLLIHLAVEGDCYGLPEEAIENSMRPMPMKFANAPRPPVSSGLSLCLQRRR